MAHFVGIASEFTMIITLSTTGGDVLVDADAPPTVAVKDSAGTTVATPVVAHPSLGTYTVSWTPTGAGDFTVEWSYLYSTLPYGSVESFSVFPLSVTPSIPAGAPGYVAEIKVVDEDGVPLENMGVQVYDEANAVLLATGYTDVAGEVDFTVQVGRYQVRFYGEHLLASVRSPRQINVRVPPPSNLWQFSATTFTAPVSPNPYMCRCWGHFRTASGRPLANMMIRLLPKQDPAVIGFTPQAMSQGAVQLTTDASGYAQVDLPRGATFELAMSGYLDSLADFVVPAQAGFNLVDIIFPTPTALGFAPVGPTALSVGGTADYVPTLTMSDGRVLSETTDALSSSVVEYTSSDETVMTVSTTGAGVRVTAVGAGAATLTATVRAAGVMPRVPAAVFTVTPVAVTVT